MKKPAEYGDIHWLPDTEYQKVVGQLRLQIGAALSPLRLYGQGAYVDEVAAVVVSLCEDFGLRVRGIDHPVSLETVARKNGFRSVTD